MVVLLPALGLDCCHLSSSSDHMPITQGVAEDLSDPINFTHANSLWYMYISYSVRI